MSVWDNQELVPSQRILKIINLSIAVLIFIVLLAAYWLLWRPLPKTSGVIQAPISKTAHIRRDRLGVPHIVAATQDDALFLQGYVTAQDRFWQMEATRRYAAGELSEVIGASTLELDKDARRLRMKRIAEEHTRRLVPAERALMAAYARGVNFYLEQSRGKYPVEFALLRYDPRPWTVEDCVLSGLQMFLNLTNTWRDDLAKMSLLETGDRRKVDYLLPVRTGLEPSPGSNAWVVAGSHTASGKPILANDPHLEWAMPSTWYMVHLQAPGLNVSGASLPGVPCVIIGHNDRIAWGVTNLHFDVQDVYIERFNPQTGQYLFRGQAEQARLENDVIVVKDGKPVPISAWVTRHGPLIQAGERFFAMKWMAAEPEGFGFPLLDIDRARNWTEFSAALSRFTGPGQNFVYADVDGNIGYQATGRLPIRQSYVGDVPVDGSSGENEWAGAIPFEQLPSAYNPPSGLIVTANQNPFPADYPLRVNGNFASHYRSSQIRRLLSSREKGWKADEMFAVQKDVYSAFAQFLAKQAIAAFDRVKTNNTTAAQAIEVLRSWNGQMDKDSPAALVTDVLYQQIRKALAESASPKKGELYSSQMAAAVVERILRERPAGWFADYDRMLMDSLAAAVEDGAKRQGGKVSDWRWGAYNELRIAHPVLGRVPMVGYLPWVGHYFEIGPVWMSGSSTTVKQTTRRLGPSMRMVVDLGNLDGSFQNVTIGESGHVLSPHFKDEWQSYYVGNSLPMQFEKVDVKADLVVDPAY